MATKPVHKTCFTTLCTGVVQLVCLCMTGAKLPVLVYDQCACGVHVAFAVKQV